MRKGLTIVTILVLVIAGFMAMAAPAAAKHHDNTDWFMESADAACDTFENDAVPHGEMKGWLLIRQVENIFSGDMTDVVIKDKLAPELMICQGCPDDIPDPWCSQGQFVITTKGNTDRVWLEWDVGTIPSGGSATMFLIMVTDINPKGQREYTTPGDYMLNSGPVITYNLDGVKYRETTDGIGITVV